MTTPKPSPGRIAVVGTGIRPSRQLTPEARMEIDQADVLFHLLAEPTSRDWIDSIHSDARSLHHHYSPGKDRAFIYEAMVEEVLAEVRSGRRVCLTFYGHPGVFVTPSHEVIRRARAEGYEAMMLPGISAADCLFADLGIDPGDGWQGYEATDFVFGRDCVDTTAHLVLWQVGVTGEHRAAGEPTPAGLAAIKEKLVDLYGADYEAVVYEASPYPIGHAQIMHVPLGDLGKEMLTTSSTLFVPARRRPSVSRATLESVGFVTD
jgi:uncharacterized protein YabN with tetrapyrrole methylase and pyrophosphatase domain